MDDPVFEFGEFRLDVRQRRCVRRVDGQPVPLAARAFDTLAYLVEHAGELVDKSTLLAALWPGTVVEENSLNKQISAVRRALGEEGGRGGHIATVAGRGYQFVVPVSRIRGPRPGVRSPDAIARRTSVAVLPFVNMTGDPAKEYLGLGIAEELINALARVPRLEVPARTSSFVYHGRSVDVRDIARDLGVSAVLEGSVRVTEDRMRITAQLVDGLSGYHLWSQAFDRRSDDLFELQDELARAIVQALRVEIDSSLPTIPRMVLPPTRDLEAYRLYLEGAALAARGTIPDHERSRALMRQAIERDPEFAHPHMGLAFTEATGMLLGLLPLSCLDGAESAARRALMLDEQLALAHAALAMTCAMRGNWVQAEHGFIHARALDPGDPHIAHLHCFCVHEPVGRVQLAYEQSREVHERAPAWLPGAAHLAVASLLADRDTEEIHRQIDVAVALGFPRARPPIPELLANLAIRCGNPVQVGDVLSMEPPTADAVFDQRTALRQVLRVIEDPSYRATALETIDRMQEALAMDEPERASWIHLISAYTHLGELERAFDCAHRALDIAARWNAIGVHWGLMWMATMKPFVAHERFPALAGRLGLARYWEIAGLRPSLR